MAHLWTTQEHEAAPRRIATGGEWRDGVYVPPPSPRGSERRNTFLQDVVRAVLELRLD